ncbi:hypothetical protein AB0C69_08010, partial [Actinomadura sp. NPDC048032]
WNGTMYNGRSHSLVDAATGSGWAAVTAAASCLPALAGIGGEGAWFDAQVARARDDRLFVAIPFFVASGTRAA